jgi:subtilase family serine protease
MRSWKLVVLLLAPSLAFAAQADRIAGPVDSGRKTALADSIHPLASPEYDQGVVEPTLPFSSVTLVMAPTPSQQTALEQLLAEQQDRTSPNYHKWLTPEQYAERFGLSQNDMNKIGLWLQSQGLTVVRVARGRNAVVFSGTAGKIQSAFSTEIHRYNINGEQRIANATPLEVPAALSGVVTAVRGLTNFRLKPMYVRASPGIHPHYTTTISGETDYFLAPGDIATLYDLTSLYNATPAIDGTGQQLAIIGETDIYLADINDFRSGFGLSTIPSTCTTDSSGIVETPCNTPNFEYILAGTDYGVSPFGDLIESDLDLEWSGATARNAQIVFVNAPISSDGMNGGVGVALQYAIDNAVAPVISMSYGLCESESEPESGISSMETLLQQANTEGITVMNSAGDTGAFACDNTPPNPTNASSVNPPYAAAIGGIQVNYPASSPEVTGVGGTSIPWGDFTATYWGSTNGTDGGSVTTNLIGQEAAWNDDPFFAQICQQEPTNSFCESGGSPAVSGWVPLGTTATAQQAQEDVWISAGGGGVSNCETEDADGICTAGFSRPSWQSVTISGVSATARLVPDVSLLASPNFPGYIICTPMNQLTGSGSDTSSSCASGIAAAVDTNFSLVGGTSAASPIFAGIVTLMNQYLGSAGLGNINQTLYTLAKNSPSSFHRIDAAGDGNNNVYCQAGTPTGQPTGVKCPSTGVDGFSATSYDADTGYNLVAGLGSVDAYNLAVAWNSRTGSAPTSITLSTNAAPPIYQGAKVTFTAVVSPSTYTGGVGFSTLNNSTNTALGNSLLNAPVGATSGTATFTTASLPVGANSVTATYLGNSSTPSGAPISAPQSVTVQQPFVLSLAAASSSIPAGSSDAVTITLAPPSPATGFSGSVQFTCSGLPSGASCSFANSGIVQFSGSTTQTLALTVTTSPDMPPVSAATITITGTCSSPAAVVSQSITLGVTKTNESFTLSSTAKTFTIGVGGTASVQLTVNGTNGFVTNNVTALPLTYTCSGIPTSAEISCQPQGNGQPTNATAVTVALVTTPVTSKLDRPFGHSGIFYAALLPGILGLAFVRPRMRSLRMLSLIIVLGFSTLWLGSCGGSKSSNTGSSSLSSGGTPPGNYSVTITGTTYDPTTVGAVPLTSSLTITLSVSANN